MENKHRQKLRKSRVELVKNLQHIEEVTDILFTNQILSESQIQCILSSSVTADRVRSLLNTLVRCGPNAYTCFVSSLESTNQSFLFDLMKEPIAEQDHNISEPSPPSSIFQPDKTIKVAENSPIIQPYPVTSSPRGYILLVNIYNFTNCPSLPPRNGSLKDVSTLKYLFEDFGYYVDILLDPDSETLDLALREFVRNPKHAEVDAGGLIIMSHGFPDHIYAADGFPVRVDNIISLFTNKAAPGLAGKPKLIILQACRGDEKDRGLIIPDSPNTTPLTLTDSPMIMGKVSWESLPHMSDCVIAYSTLPGFVAWRHEENGSRFVQTLVSVFRKYAQQLHVLDLLAEVNRVLVEEGQNLEFKQITQPVNTLVRPFFLSTAHFNK